MNEPAPHYKSMQAFSSSPPGDVLRSPVGIGLRAPHYEEILETSPDLGWLEIHPENYFCGGIHRHMLGKIRESYNLSMHGVGLSLGSDEPVNADHLSQFKQLIDDFDPFIISDHVAWSASGNAHLNDLLPLPYTEESLSKVCENIDRTQSFLNRSILVENPSTYIAFKDNDMQEYEFMNALVERTGCGILLDVNNIYVQSHNHGLDPHLYIDNINKEAVGEIHLAGHIVRKTGEHTLLIDTHNQTVCDDVWTLYEYTTHQTGTKPTLIEWDQDFPALDVLLSEASNALNILFNSSNGTSDVAE